MSSSRCLEYHGREIQGHRVEQGIGWLIAWTDGLDVRGPFAGQVTSTRSTERNAVQSERGDRL